MRHWIAITTLTAALFVQGCVDDGSTLFVSANVQPDGNCTIGPDNQAYLSGVLDYSILGAEDGYMMAPRFNAQIQERVSANGAQPNDITVRWVDVQLLDESGRRLDLGGLANPFRVATYAFLPAGSGIDPTTAAGEIEAIPPAYVNQIVAQRLQRVIVSLRPIGVTNGQIDVEGSYAFQFPIRVCDSCLVGCYLPDEEAESPCRVGQDEPIKLNPC